MPEQVEITVDGILLEVSLGTTLAAALMTAGALHFRRSVKGEPRAPLCGMGSCFECRVTVNGIPHQRACMLRCEPGMKVVTGG